MKNIIILLNTSISFFCFGLANHPQNQDLLYHKGHHFTCFIPRIGTFIHPQWCITAAHAQPIVNTPLLIEDKPYYVEKVIRHPLYTAVSPYSTESVNRKYDIALVKINKPVFNSKFMQRERNDSSCSLRNWIVSGKDGKVAAGLVQLYNPQNGAELFSYQYYTCFYNTLENFNQEKYVFNDRYNQKIKNFHLKPTLENSALKVWIEDGDSGASTFNFPAGYNPLYINLNLFKLTGVTVSKLKKITQDNFLETEGHMGIIVRLPYTGLNEFIDTTILKDALDN